MNTLEEKRVIIMSGDDAMYLQSRNASAVCREREIRMEGARARYADGVEAMHLKLDVPEQAAAMIVEYTLRESPRAGAAAAGGDASGGDGGRALPEVLRSERARALLLKAQDHGWLDADLQPTVSRADAALLAARLGLVLGIDGWKPFEELWCRQNMRQDFCKGNGRKSSDDFIETLKKALR